MLSTKFVLSGSILNKDASICNRWTDFDENWQKTISYKITALVSDWYAFCLSSATVERIFVAGAT